jgi:SAM-dependent methyltransferase
MRRGEPWRRAVEAVAVAAGRDEALESIASEACANWVWLTSFVRRDAALDVGGSVSSMAPALTRHFRVVYHVEESPLLAEFAAHRFAQDKLESIFVARAAAGALPFPDDAFDCVTLHGTFARGTKPLRAATARTVVAECRRVLRADGRLYVSFDNPNWYGRLTDARGWPAPERVIVPAIDAVGFRDPQRYYAFPTFDRPRELVPSTRSAAYARETIVARGTIRRALRRATAAAGLYALLAPSVVIVARK